MLQCHFSSSILSKHFVVYESVPTSHLVFFHSKLPAICRTRVQCIAEHPNPLWFVVDTQGMLRISLENEVMVYLDTLIIALITGGVSSLGTIAALKTDINWIKRVQQDQEQRIRKLEDPNG
ncbi:hypothetical protein [Vibrio splendidus]|uniref:hypothetical protein n=1 Tax=Vibrio splendidus TaxID=29497 RepID=UPI0012FFDBF7|nr:hypothetical protein [Vibrio splendidus]